HGAHAPHGRRLGRGARRALPRLRRGEVRHRRPAPGRRRHHRQVQLKDDTMTAAAEGRLTPLPPAQWVASLAPVPAGLKTPLNIHTVIARHPAVMLSYVDFRNHVVKDSSLSPRQREILILRVAHVTGAAYEWEHHVVRGRAAGLSD